MDRRRWLSCAVVMALSGDLACAVAGSHGKSGAAALAPEQPPSAPDGIELVLVKGGCFRMGNTFESGGPEEKPVHEVCVDDFYMGKYEVTRLQWQDITGSAAPAGDPNCGDACPVEMVSWEDAQAFIARLNARSAGGASPSGQYRLPTEAEWEYAARSGGKDERYAGPGTDVDRIAWHFWDGGVTQEVGLKAPNGLGLHDMSGNVWEWTGDWYGETYYSTSPRENPAGPAAGDRRVLRGGSAACPPFDLRASYRNHLPPGYRGAGKGFRVVMAAPRQRAPVEPVALAEKSAAPASPRGPSIFKDPATGMEFVRVEGGCFEMGDVYGDVVEGDPEARALPAHEVCVDGFFVGKYEVTRGQWRSLMPSDPSSEPTCGADCPVDNVTFRDIQEFIRRLNVKDGARRYRLPTEAEWEYAARSGGKIERYSGGNDVESVSVFGCSTIGGACIRPVGSKLPSGLGVHDMSGNVYEVTSDWLSSTYYSTSVRDNPTGPESGKYRVERGGCGSGSPRNSRVSRRRHFADPSESSGFRLLRIP